MKVIFFYKIETVVSASVNKSVSIMLKGFLKIGLWWQYKHPTLEHSNINNHVRFFHFTYIFATN